ncbi:MAG: TIGR04002 family protein [Clostridia bacterium]|nr:TIGR04002 family protein [Clostridia bacterium]
MSKTKQLAVTAMFAAFITVLTGFFFKIPTPGGGYIHLGDSLIYLASCVLPLPFAMAAAAIGAGLADLLGGYAAYVLPTMIVKSLLCLPFTRHHEKFLCMRNVIAMAVCAVITPVGYALAEMIMYQSVAAGLEGIPGNIVQGIGSAVLFTVIAFIFDKSGVKHKVFH